MSEKYTGIPQDRRYEGDEVDITYNLKRCIHAEECIHRLSEVFNVTKRPWIDANAALPEQIADVIAHCPSGALHFIRKDEGDPESVPAENIIKLWENGPLQVSGELVIQGATVSVGSETRATLCRCGASKNKPFCDNSHKDIDFVAEEKEARSLKEQTNTGKLNISPEPNGPLRIDGNCIILGVAGNALFVGERTALCRCGASQSKPFCDGSHNTIEFVAD